jgi:tyrosyl-tRNA synthetase
MIYKKELAFELTKMLNSEQDAKKAQESFEKVFSRKEMPDEMREIALSSQEILNILIESGLAESKSSAKRLIEQRAVKIDGETINDLNATADKVEYILQVGKRNFVRIKRNA